MILYLTSDPGGAIDNNGTPEYAPFKKENAFLANITQDMNELFPDRNNRKCLIIAAAPDNYELNDAHVKVFTKAFNETDLGISQIDICDNRHPELVSKLGDYELIFLIGGHAPIQNKFLEKLELKDKIKDYTGIILSLSAGSMNCAQIAYMIPEYEDELNKPKDNRFVAGLGLTSYQIIPHFQWIKTQKLNGLNIIDDIVCTDSHGHEFIGLCDGSYFRIEDDDFGSTLYGEAYGISDGDIWQL